MSNISIVNSCESAKKFSLTLSLSFITSVSLSNKKTLVSSTYIIVYLVFYFVFYLGIRPFLSLCLSGQIFFANKKNELMIVTMTVVQMLRSYWSIEQTLNISSSLHTDSLSSICRFLTDH